MKNQKNKFANFYNFALSVALAVFGLTAAVSAQTSAAQLKSLCETNPNNTVFVTLEANILGLPGQPETLVNTGCTVVLAPDAKFVADTVQMRFNGSFNIQGSDKATVDFKSSEFNAASLSFNLAGSEGFIGTDVSTLRAVAGNLSINTGRLGNVDVKSPRVAGQSSLESAGTISIIGNDGFTGVFDNANVRAASGFSLSMSGTDSTFTSALSEIRTTSGSLSIASPSPKNVIEVDSGSLSAGNGIDLSLSNAETSINLQTLTLNAGAGSINLLAGSGANSFGKISVGETSASGAGAFTANASANGNEGGVTLDKATFNFGSDISLATGALGTTKIVNSNLTSNTLIRATSGGVCLSEVNILIAPFLQVCQ